MLFYIIRTDSGEPSISPIVQGDKLPSRAEMLTPGLPLAFAQSLIEILKSQQVKKGKQEILKFLLRKHSGLASMDWRWRSTQPEAKNPIVHTQEVEVDVEEFAFASRVQSRQLSEADFQRLANEMGLNLKEVILLCHESVLQGQAEWIPAVQKEGQGWRCMRCGETEIKEWPSIYGLAGTCPSCAALGALSSLQTLYRSLGPHPDCKEGGMPFAKLPENQGLGDSVELQPVRFSPHWTLSLAQEQASQGVLEFVSTETGKNLLLWAACGAGKTEVCFPAAAWALERGQKVLFAAPRQDVVLDVAPRLERDFPELSVSVLTGVSTERFSPAPLVLATTHQVLRFYQAFDLIFMDEVDAFPYHGNAALAWGLQQSLKPGGKIVYLTATPSPENRAKVQNKGMQLVRLPARHHRKALPVPEWIKYSTNQEVASQWIKALAESGPVLIFVPKISWVNMYVEKLHDLFPGWAIEGSYSSDPGRREKIERLRKDEYRVFISTSILERGVTIPNAQVMVLAADHELFDERALVQMAGRVGRTQENPEGRALFLAKHKTPAIEKAIHWIQEQNRLALEQGLIDPF
ncbi:helicase-related protein [Desulfitobacterium sp.]|uniref:helicase-related protein n=1 Tax=Desulfitobacterium sp. TaxID=49981 RepID=UPI002C8F75E5|nr:helicase-related protein [Desulfitobacterium sp.]HVJ47987.1 helicase-related protein [Desulfitobacterium sp.]